jgi:hypothetical protein
MVRLEESADQHVGFLRSTMMRAPREALQIRIGGHGRHVVTFERDCERRNSR